jgi:hypothetical protein
MKSTEINKLSLLYIMQGIVLTIIMFLIGLMVGNHWNLPLFVPLLVSVAFASAIIMAEALIWRWVAIKSAASLPTFFTALSGFRMLLALATMLVYYLSEDHSLMVTFFLVFMTFYIMLITHHSIFFAKVSNRS